VIAKWHRLFSNKRALNRHRLFSDKRLPHRVAYSTIKERQIAIAYFLAIKERQIAIACLAMK
jgi:hypothetical protein